MNTIAAASPSVTKASALTSKAGINATGLPDFALLLGMALSLNDLEQNLGGKAVTMGGSATGTAQGAPASGNNILGSLAGGAINIAASEPGKETPAAEETTAGSEAVAAIVSAQAMQAALTGGQTAPGKETAGKMATAQRATRTLAQPGTNPDTPTSQAAAAKIAAVEGKIWNVRDLAHQIRSALGSVAQTATVQESAAAPTATPAALPASFLTRAEGDRIRTAGLNKLLQTSLDGKKTEPTLAIQPATPQPGASIKALTEQFLSGAAPKNQAAAVATSAVTPPLDNAGAEADLPAAPLDGSPAPLVWTAQPTAAPTQETRMPTLIEQVRQVADFLAERTDGVVRMGDKGVEANLKLYPPDLGGVRVQLSVMNNGATQAQFIVERPETAQLLQQNMRSFMQGLESHGLTVDRVQVTVQQTVRPTSGGAESGWRQNGTQDSRREASDFRERQEQSSRRNGRGGGQNFAEA